MPMMKSSHADQLMDVFEEVLGKPAHLSIFRNNMNPLKVGL